jgi:hypothetical protein
LEGRIALWDVGYFREVEELFGAQRTCGMQRIYVGSRGFLLEIEQRISVGIGGSPWEAVYRCGKQRIAVKSRGSLISVESKGSIWETECLSEKQSVSLGSQIFLRKVEYISARNRGSVWEGELILWEAENFKGS